MFQLRYMNMLYQKIMVSTWLIWHLLLFFSLKWPDMGLKWTFICSKFSLYPSIMLDHLSYFAKRVVRLNDHCRTAAKHLECLQYNQIIFKINLYLALHAVYLWVQKFAKKGRQKNRRHWTWKLMQRDIVEFMSEKSHKNPSVFNIRALRVHHTNIKRLL